jgi:hypothetical protein
MATYSRKDLRNAVLQEIGVVDGQGAPSAEDAALADARCQQQLEYLYDQGLIPFDLDGEIPARFFIPLVQAIAPVMIGPFGLVSRAQMLFSTGQVGMRALSRLKAHRYMGTTQQAEYY